MNRLSYILLVAAGLSAGPGMLWAQPDNATEPGKGRSFEKDRSFGPPPGGEGRPPGDWGRRGKDGRSFRNPMDDFRRWLTLSQEEREAELASKPDGFRDMMLRKLKEYDALTPQQQELRLQSTELRFDMMYLLRASPERRADKLERMSADRRKLAEARLEQWDKLPAELQQEVLEHQSTIQYVVRIEAAPAAAKEDVFAGMSPEYRDKVKARVAEVNALPKDQRARMIDNFHQLFDLSDSEQDTILEKLNQTEREKVEQKIKEYEKLSPEDRKKCIDSARKFNNLTAEEQARFIESAERWEKMSEDERNAWRNLIKKMPPLPPGMVPQPPALPPLPKDK